MSLITLEQNLFDNIQLTQESWSKDVWTNESLEQAKQFGHLLCKLSKLAFLSLTVLLVAAIYFPQLLWNAGVAYWREEFNKFQEDISIGTGLTTDEDSDSIEDIYKELGIPSEIDAASITLDEARDAGTTAEGIVIGFIPPSNSESELTTHHNKHRHVRKQQEN